MQYSHTKSTPKVQTKAAEERAVAKALAAVAAERHADREALSLTLAEKAKGELLLADCRSRLDQCERMLAEAHAAANSALDTIGAAGEKAIRALNAQADAEKSHLLETHAADLAALEQAHAQKVSADQARYAAELQRLTSELTLATAKAAVKSKWQFWK